MAELHPRTREIITFLDDNRRLLEREVRAVPKPRQTTRPADDRWSVAEIVEHLAIVEARIGGVLARVLEEASAVGIPAEVEESSVLDRLDTRLLLDRTNRLVASEPSRPGGQLPLDAAWEQLTASRAKTRGLVERANGLALGTVHAPHPRLGAIDVYQWLLFLGAHEGRHAAQVHEVATELASH